VGAKRFEPLRAGVSAALASFEVARLRARVERALTTCAARIGIAACAAGGSVFRTSIDAAGDGVVRARSCGTRCSTRRGSFYGCFGTRVVISTAEGHQCETDCDCAGEAREFVPDRFHDASTPFRVRMNSRTPSHVRAQRVPTNYPRVDCEVQRVLAQQLRACATLCACAEA